jgi:hypothetical protein
MSVAGQLGPPDILVPLAFRQGSRSAALKTSGTRIRVPTPKTAGPVGRLLRSAGVVVQKSPSSSPQVHQGDF